MNILNHIWKKWLTIAKIIGNFQGQVIFSLFYLIFLSLVAIPLAIFNDPLKQKRQKKQNSNWSEWKYTEETLIQATHPY